MKVLVVGGGIGGLAAALHLHASGLDCTVFEQSGEIRELGVGVNVLPPAVGHLDGLGLLRQLDDIAVRTAELIYTNRAGQLIWREPRGLDAGHDAPQLSVHRGRLQGVLSAAVHERLGSSAIRAGHRLIGLDQDADGVTAYFVDRFGNPHEPIRGDVLLGADGIHSSTRAILFPDSGPVHWNGVMMWRGATEWPPFMTGRSALIAGGTAAKLVVYPIGAGRRQGSVLTNWVLAVQTGDGTNPPPRREDWSRTARMAEIAPFLNLFQLPYLDLPGLVAATREVFEFPMCDRDPIPRWSDGVVTLLGDAAHPMLPMGSNGATQAILDAASLAGHLKGATDPAAALRAYERERLPVTSEIVLMNRVGGPERVIDEVERRAPDGFDQLDDVVSRDELRSIVESYGMASGLVARS